MMTNELKLNPLGDRVTKVFSSRGDGLMTFDDYLDMYSALVSNEYACLHESTSCLLMYYVLVV